MKSFLFRELIFESCFSYDFDNLCSPSSSLIVDVELYLLKPVSKATYAMFGVAPFLLFVKCTTYTNIKKFKELHLKRFHDIRSQV